MILQSVVDFFGQSSTMLSYQHSRFNLLLFDEALRLHHVQP